jgi:hypothetical protein
MLFVLPALLLLFYSCAGTQKKRTLLDSSQGTSSLLRDKMDTFEARGDIAASFNGERHRGELFVSLKDGTVCTCVLYTPFAQILASFTSDNDSARIVLGKCEYRIGIHEDVSRVPFLTQYPFIFSDFIRILTGRVFKNDLVSRDADTVWEKGARKNYEWTSDSLAMAMTVSKVGRRIKSISYIALKGSQWKLVYASFKNGISRKINFESGEKSYFSLVFDSIRLE